MNPSIHKPVKKNKTYTASHSNTHTKQTRQTKPLEHQSIKTSKALAVNQPYELIDQTHAATKSKRTTYDHNENRDNYANNSWHRGNISNIDMNTTLTIILPHGAYNTAGCPKINYESYSRYKYHPLPQTFLDMKLLALKQTVQ